MKVAVLGGGIVGVATAYYLVRDGHEVTLIERHKEAASETSFANAGQIAPGHCGAWASPRAPGILLRSFFRDDTAFKLYLRAVPGLWRWGPQFLRECTAERFRRNSNNKLRLCLYSRDMLGEMRRETGIAYDESTNGCLFLHREQARFEADAARVTELNALGLELKVLDPKGAAKVDPVLAQSQSRLVGAIYSPQDECGDSSLLGRRLVESLTQRQMRAMFETDVLGLEAEGDKVTGVRTSKGSIKADAFVMSLGSYSPGISRTIGVDLPIYPVKGYSLTLPITRPAGAPRCGMVDEHALVGMSPLGNRLRLGGKAVFKGFDTTIDKRDFGGMFKVARDLFPDGLDFEKPFFWSCLRPMTADGPPILGTARHKNLFLNTGHGHIGWTMAAGSGRITADLVAGKKPAIDLTGFTLPRA
jgi:D-amino-acid dehydrogenase